MATSRVCSIPNCGKPHSAKGLCIKHYAKKQRTRSDQPCSVDDCTKPSDRRGYCTAHYMRWRRGGSPTSGRIARGTIQAFFDNVVRTEVGDECLQWPFSRTNGGYATGKIDGEQRNVSRYICVVTLGPPSAGCQAAHNCGNGHLGCVNPRHLEWKTRVDNMADTLKHGTRMRGERHHATNLKNADVLEIRRLEGVTTTRFLADKYNLTTEHVRLIQRRKSWSYLPEG